MRLDVALLLNMLQQSKNSASKTNLRQRLSIKVKKLLFNLFDTNAVQQISNINPGLYYRK